ncbi:MAG TPA: hypothetical protein VNZ22_15525 [Bacillota bacterium]|nr:hypothetical protein [Bacillota bacterium]
MKIVVTQEDIKHGRRCDPDCCPVARALLRAGLAHLGVVGTTVLITDANQQTTALPLPGAVKEWILDFDGNQPVQPFSFELALPDESLRQPSNGPSPPRQPEVLAA